MVLGSLTWQEKIKTLQSLRQYLDQNNEVNHIENCDVVF